MLNRRDLLRAAGVTVVALHAPIASKATDPRPRLDSPPALRLRRLRLPSDHLDANFAFYRDVFGWPVEWQGPDRFVVHVGATELEFERAPEGMHPFFHFAFNISHNKFDQAKAWLAERTDLVLTPDGKDQVHFANRDADAIYYLDGGGHLGEFIAHYRLDNERDGDFGLDDVEGACEIGIVSPNVPETVRWLGDTLGAAPYPEPREDFAEVGDERGYFIVVQTDRLWFPPRVRPAADYPTGVWIEGEEEREVVVPGTRVEVRVG